MVKPLPTLAPEESDANTETDCSGVPDEFVTVPLKLPPGLSRKLMFAVRLPTVTGTGVPNVSTKHDAQFAWFVSAPAYTSATKPLVPVRT